MTFKQKVLGTIKKFDMFRKNERVLVGVSGGPDSLALLYCLLDLRKEFNLNLFVAHLDHALRRQSGKDAQFVREVAKKFNLPVLIYRIDVKKKAKKGSLEEICRNARHKFFKIAAKKFSLKKIALGHNQDDQAETVLMRILRGSGLYGLKAIAGKRYIEGLTFVRPLIEVKRKEINSFLKQNNIRPRIDTTNFEPIFFRNRVRNELIPVLESKFTSNISGKLSSLADIISRDYDYLSAEARKRLKTVIISKRKTAVSLALKKFNNLHISMQRMVVRFCIQGLLGSTRKFDFRHWREIEDLISSRPVGSIVDLPKNVSVLKQGGRLKFYIRKG